jgi:hypothetical protein
VLSALSSHHTAPTGAIPPAPPLSGKCDGFSVALAFGHHGPGQARDFVGERNRGDLRRPALEQSRKPRAMLGAVDLGVADDRQRARREQAAQIAISLLGDAAELFSAPAVLLRDQTDPRREVAARSEGGEGRRRRPASGSRFQLLMAGWLKDVRSSCSSRGVLSERIGAVFCEITNAKNIVRPASLRSRNIRSGS